MKTLALVCTLCAAGFAQAAGTITVNGTGKVTYTPDIAYVSFGVSSQQNTAAEAWRKNAESIKKIFALLKELGIAEKDMQTTGVNVSPKYHYEKDKQPVLVGYVATYDLTVTVRKLADVGKVLDAGVEGGANQSVGLRFACANPEKLQDEARAAAVADARKKANLLVTGAGAQLGLVQSISEGGFAPERDYRFAAPKEALSALPIATGEQQMSISVTLTYNIVHASR